MVYVLILILSISYYSIIILVTENIMSTFNIQDRIAKGQETVLSLSAEWRNLNAEIKDMQKNIRWNQRRQKDIEKLLSEVREELFILSKLRDANWQDVLDENFAVAA
jgi:peptidoglycan hydrolase CwlO-like protein